MTYLPLFLFAILSASTHTLFFLPKNCPFLLSGSIFIFSCSFRVHSEKMGFCQKMNIRVFVGLSARLLSHHETAFLFHVYQGNGFIRTAGWCKPGGRGLCFRFISDLRNVSVWYQTTGPSHVCGWPSLVEPLWKEPSWLEASVFNVYVYVK